MPIAVQCSKCSSRLSAPDSAAGKTVKCPKCGNSITIPTAAAFEVVDEAPAPAAKKPASAKPVAAKARAVVVDDDDDEKPRKKAKAVVEDEEEEKPRKKARAVVEEEEEEEETPRKKKGKKGKKAGTSPAMLYGGIAAGVLLVAGIGFAVYWFGIREKPAETANSGGTGNPTPPGPGTPGPVIPGGKPPGWEDPATAKYITRNWKEFASAEHGFKATFPWYAPPTSPWAQPPEGVTKAARFEVQYSEPGGILTFFTVMAIQLKPGSAADHNKTVDKLIELMHLSPDLKPSAPKQVTLGGKPATEVVYEMAQPDAKGKKSRIVMRRLVTDTAAYLVYVHEHGRIQPEDFATFFDSFALTK